MQLLRRAGAGVVGDHAPALRGFLIDIGGNDIRVPGAFFSQHFNALQNAVNAAAQSLDPMDFFGAGPNRAVKWREGPENLEAAIWAENIPFNETRDYVKKVLANTTMYAALLNGQPQSLKRYLGQISPAPSTATVQNADLP